MLRIYRLNLEEFVRVGIGARDPTDVGMGLAGSRASDKFNWHARHQIDVVSGAYVRSTGDDPESNEKDIGAGHIDLHQDPYYP